MRKKILVLNGASYGKAVFGLGEIIGRKTQLWRTLRGSPWFCLPVAKMLARRSMVTPA
jgi:hypothetical protein